MCGRMCGEIHGYSKCGRNGGYVYVIMCIKARKRTDNDRASERPSERATKIISRQKKRVERSKSRCNISAVLTSSKDRKHKSRHPRTRRRQNKSNGESTTRNAGQPMQSCEGDA